jgi:hypothetical protein
MAQIIFDWMKYDAKVTDACLGRMEIAANLIKNEAKSIIAGKLKRGWKEHGPYKKGKYAGAFWTAREYDAMAETIRVTKKEGRKDIWIRAGNKKTWWATQMEYGRGAWRGGPRSFMRPALDNTSGIKAALENGHAATDF